MADKLLSEALEDLVEHRDLTAERAAAVMDRIMQGGATPAQIGGLLVALRAKGETVDELTGMVSSMRAHATRITIDPGAVDTCGTGGDSSGTFNISTAAALVAAGAGCVVAKHGNRAASSRCGSADVLEALGVAIALSPDGVRRCVEEAGIGFLFAPAFHPAMRHAASARRDLGVRTVFNILGPLANPAGVRYQALGVGDPLLARAMAEVLHRLGHRRALVFAGPEGLDELGLAGPAKAYQVTPDGVTSFSVDPGALGLDSAPLEALRGGDAEDNAQRIRDILSGTPGPPRDVVLLNAAAAIVAAERTATLTEAMDLGRVAIDSGAAQDRLESLVRISQREAAT